MSTENWTEIKEWTKSLLKYRLYGNRRIYIDAIYLNIKDRITLKLYSCTEGSRFKYTTKFSFEWKWCLYTKDAIKWLTSDQKSSKFLTPVLYSRLSLWIRASTFLHLRRLEDGTSPRLTASTDYNRLIPCPVETWRKKWENYYLKFHSNQNKKSGLQNCLKKS
jgi:hypothetical protein